MVSGSVLAIAKKKTEVAVGLLFSTLIVQGLGYGILFNASVVFRNLSIIGGLMMLLADAMSKKRATGLLNQLNETDRAMYVQLLGRILLVGLLFSFMMNGEMGIIRILVIISSLVSCKYS